MVNDKESISAVQTSEEAIAAGRLDDSPIELLSLPGADRTWWQEAYALTKRPVGFVTSLLLMAINFPLMLVIVLVLAFQGGPVFIRRKRLGHHGQPFTSYYFRTMNSDSLSVLHSQVQGEKLGDRHTSGFGHFLTRTRMDRLPLLFNVVRGDMSLVGPRALSHEELVRAGRAARHTLSVRPGVTGLWWLEHETDLRRRLALDRTYQERISPILDLRILLQTLLMVRRGS